MPRARVGQLVHYVAAIRRCVHDVKLVHARMVHGKALVMLGGKDHVLHARVGDELCPFVGIKQYRVECRRKRMVFRVRYAIAGLQPFADVVHALTLPFARGQAVQPPVYHHAEFSFLEPFEFVHNIPPRAAQCF